MKRIVVLVFLLLHMQAFASQMRECAMPKDLTVKHIVHDGKDIRVATRPDGYASIELNNQRYEYDPQQRVWETLRHISCREKNFSGDLYLRGKVKEQKIPTLQGIVAIATKNRKSGKK